MKSRASFILCVLSALLLSLNVFASDSMPSTVSTDAGEIALPQAKDLKNARNTATSDPSISEDSRKELNASLDTAESDLAQIKLERYQKLFSENVDFVYKISSSLNSKILFLLSKVPEMEFLVSLSPPKSVIEYPFILLLDSSKTKR